MMMYAVVPMVMMKMMPNHPRSEQRCGESPLASPHSRSLREVVFGGIFGVSVTVI
jgi:hypothetical protein